MKQAYCLIIFTFFSFSVHAQTVLMRGDSGGITTGDLLEGTRDAGITTNVQEITGLMVSARTDNPDHKLNSNGESFGINNMLTNLDEAARFEADEKMILSFSENVTITNLDFRFFDAGETFTLAVSGQSPVVIAYENLDNRISDYISTNIYVAANTEVEFFTTNDGQVGLESIGIRVETGAQIAPALSMSGSNGLSYVAIDFGAATNRYALQSSTNLVSNGWTTVTGTISADTNIAVDVSHDSAFFRLIVE